MFRNKGALHTNVASNSSYLKYIAFIFYFLFLGGTEFSYNTTKDVTSLITVGNTAQHTVYKLLQVLEH